MTTNSIKQVYTKPVLTNLSAAQTAQGKGGGMEGGMMGMAGAVS